MRRTLKTLSPCLVAFLLMLTVAFAGNAQELQKKLEGLKGISGIEKLESDHYAEKYLVRITQPVDHKNPAAGTFTQRVIVAHVGFDRPTILVTEGYGAAYALNPSLSGRAVEAARCQYGIRGIPLFPRIHPGPPCQLGNT